jgi:hypothetical protein
VIGRSIFRPTVGWWLERLFVRCRLVRVSFDAFVDEGRSNGATDMPNTVEIIIAPRGWEVRMGARVSRFASIEDALEFASQRLNWARELRELKQRCE